jgi:hypothetical protein
MSENLGTGALAAAALTKEPGLGEWEWGQKELAATPGSDPRKVALARLLWRGTTVSPVWLAERLAMRSTANVSQQWRRVRTERNKGNLPKSLASFVERVGGRDQRLSTFAH